MKFIDKEITSSYYQVYCILDRVEKLKYYKAAKELAFHDEKDILLDKLAVYKKINKNNDNDKTTEKIKKVSEKLKNLHPDNAITNRDDLIDYMADVLEDSFFKHLDDLKIALVFDPVITMIGNMEDNNSLTFINSFCYIKESYDLHLPTRKGNPYIFTLNDAEMLKTEIMLGMGYYKRVESDKITEFSDIVFDYQRKDTKQKDVTMDIRRMELEFNVDTDTLLNLKMGENIIEPNYLDSDKITINLKKIYNKEVFELTDYLVKKMDIFDIQTVSELNQKIIDVFSFTLNLNNNLIDLTDQLVNLNEIEIDNNVKKHFLMYMGKKDVDIDPSKMINDIKSTFLTTLIFKLNPDLDFEKYVYYMADEYVLVRLMKKAIGENSMEDYFMIKAPLYALYEFFRRKNLITERR